MPWSSIIYQGKMEPCATRSLISTFMGIRNNRINMFMKILEQKVEAKKVLQMIDARLEAVTRQYHHAVSDERKMEAEALAETKWQLAELKMQFADLLCEQVTTNISS